MGIYRFAKTEPVHWRDVRVAGGFWQRMIDLGRSTGLPAMLSVYDEHHIARTLPPTPAARPHAPAGVSADHDEALFRTLEACNYYLAVEPADELAHQYERVRRAVLSAPRPDGRLYAPDARHEMRAAAHLALAGLAERERTGHTLFFEAARRHMDCLIAGRRVGKSSRLDGQFHWGDHPSFGLALIELYRATGQAEYLKLCRANLRQTAYGGRRAITGHPANEVLHAAWATDCGMETGDQNQLAAGRRLWKDMTRKVQAMGALCSSDAPAQTCGAIGLVEWSWRMFLASGRGKHIDMLERALYNGVLAGMSIDASNYRHHLPLEFRADDAAGPRKAPPACSCCAPTVHRTIGAMGQYAYAAAGKSLWVNLFVASHVQAVMAGGVRVRLHQRTDYPWRGEARIRVELTCPTSMCLKIRNPGWCRGTSVRVNAQELFADTGRDGYISIDRTWADGDVVDVELPMPPRIDRSQEGPDHGKAVIARGPIVYCLEGHDNPELDLFSVTLSARTKFQETRCRDLLGDVIVLTGSTMGPAPAVKVRRAGPTTPTHLVAIPYYAWANRGPGDMVAVFPYAAR